MAKKSRQNSELTTSDKFYIDQHKSMSAEDLSKTLDKPTDIIKNYQNSSDTTPLQKPQRQLFHSPVNSQNKSKGITISTRLASEAGDEPNETKTAYSHIRDAIHKPLQE